MRRRTSSREVPRWIRAAPLLHASGDNVAAIRRRNQRVHRGTSEPPTVALLRHVLNPSVIVLTLMLCVFLFSQELTPAYFALAALAFLIASQVVSEPVMDCSARNGLHAICFGTASSPSGCWSRGAAIDGVCFQGH